MRRRAIITVAASCLMAACAHQTPTAMPGMAWSLHHSEGEGEKLAFGQPSSDNVLMMMTCEPGSGDVRLSLATAPDASPDIRISSRGQTARYGGEVVPSIGDGALIEAEAKAADPALARFARTGDIAVLEGGRRTALPVRAGEKADIQAFFARCAA